MSNVRIYKVEVLGKKYLSEASTQSQAINNVVGHQVKCEVIGTSELAEMLQAGFPIIRKAPEAQAPAAAEGVQASPQPEAAVAATGTSFAAAGTPTDAANASADGQAADHSGSVG